MSFGFSVSDLFLLGSTAWKALKNSRKAFGEHDELTREVSALHVVLQWLRHEISKPESLINRPEESCREELKIILADCKKVLGVLDSLLVKYNDLSTSERDGDQLWQKLKFGNKEMSELPNLRGKLSYYNGTISCYLNLVSIGSVGRIEKQIDEAGDDLKDIKFAVNDIAIRLSAKSDHEGSILTTYTDDDKNVWKEIRRELIEKGFPSPVLVKHKGLIINYIEELGRRGFSDNLDLYQESHEQELNKSPADCQAMSLDTDVANRRENHPTSTAGFNGGMNEGGSRAGTHEKDKGKCSLSGKKANFIVSLDGEITFAFHQTPELSFNHVKMIYHERLRPQGEDYFEILNISQYHYGVREDIIRGHRAWDERELDKLNVLIPECEECLTASRFKLDEELRYLVRKMKKAAKITPPPWTYHEMWHFYYEIFLLQWICWAKEGGVAHEQQLVILKLFIQTINAFVTGGPTRFERRRTEIQKQELLADAMSMYEFIKVTWPQQRWEWFDFTSEAFYNSVIVEPDLVNHQIVVHRGDLCHHCSAQEGEHSHAFPSHGRSDLPESHRTRKERPRRMRIPFRLSQKSLSPSDTLHMVLNTFVEDYTVRHSFFCHHPPEERAARDREYSSLRAALVEQCIPRLKEIDTAVITYSPLDWAKTKYLLKGMYSWLGGLDYAYGEMVRQGFQYDYLS